MEFAYASGKELNEVSELSRNIAINAIASRFTNVLFFMIHLSVTIAATMATCRQPEGHKAS